MFTPDPSRKKPNCGKIALDLSLCRDLIRRSWDMGNRVWLKVVILTSTRLRRFEPVSCYE